MVFKSWLWWYDLPIWKVVKVCNLFRWPDYWNISNIWKNKKWFSKFTNSETTQGSIIERSLPQNRIDVISYICHFLHIWVFPTWCRSSHESQVGLFSLVSRWMWCHQMYIPLYVSDTWDDMNIIHVLLLYWKWDDPPGRYLTELLAPWGQASSGSAPFQRAGSFRRRPSQP